MSHESPHRLTSYVVGFILSVAMTLIAFALVEYHIWPTSALIIVISVLAVMQLIVQLVFFLHLGDEKGPRWKLVTIAFAVIVVGIVVIGSLWIMHNLDYNMQHMTPAEQAEYLKNHEGI